jgi:hypothetical protein
MLVGRTRTHRGDKGAEHESPELAKGSGRNWTAGVRHWVLQTPEPNLAISMQHWLPGTDRVSNLVFRAEHRRRQSSDWQKTVQGKASVIAPSGQWCTIVSVRKAVSIGTL